RCLSDWSSDVCSSDLTGKASFSVSTAQLITVISLKISGGSVYDPRNGIDGEIRDLWVQEGRIVAPSADPNVRADRVLNAEGLVEIGRASGRESVRVGA